MSAFGLLHLRRSIFVFHPTASGEEGSTAPYANTKLTAENIFTTFYSLIWSTLSNFVQTRRWLRCCWTDCQRTRACPIPLCLSRPPPRTCSRRHLPGSLHYSEYPWSSAACPCAFRESRKSCCCHWRPRFSDSAEGTEETAIAGRTI